MQFTLGSILCVILETLTDTSDATPAIPHRSLNCTSSLLCSTAPSFLSLVVLDFAGYHIIAEYHLIPQYIAFSDGLLSFSNMILTSCFFFLNVDTLGSWARAKRGLRERGLGSPNLDNPSQAYPEVLFLGYSILCQFDNHHHKVVILIWIVLKLVLNVLLVPLQNSYGLIIFNVTLIHHSLFWHICLQYLMLVLHV